MIDKTKFYIAVDFDGTLFTHKDSVDIHSFGEPIPLMVNRIKKWLLEGKNVKIFTARLFPHPHFPNVKPEDQYILVQNKLEEVGLTRLEVTNIKDCYMQEIWDDKAISVERNTGKVIQRIYQENGDKIINELKQGTIVITSGYFDPIHSGHIELFKFAKQLGDKLFVIVNNNKQTQLKKGKIFMEDKERVNIVESIQYVDLAHFSIDQDSTVCESIKQIVHNPSYFNYNFIFAKGGDRFKDNIPEKILCDQLGIKIIDGLGTKIQSSSNLIKNIRK